MAVGTVEKPEQREAFVAHLLERANQMFPRRGRLAMAIELHVGNVLTIEEVEKHLGISSSECRKAAAKLRRRLRATSKHAQRVSDERSADAELIEDPRAR